MAQKRCFFIGHRDAPDALAPLLQKVVDTLVAEQGVTEFIVGHYGAFDRMAARAVLRVKVQHPEIALLLLLPYHPAECRGSLPEGYDMAYFPEGLERVPRRLAIVRANREMINRAVYLIAYARYPGSNARKLVEYARSREKKGLLTVWNLGDALSQL